MNRDVVVMHRKKYYKDLNITTQIFKDEIQFLYEIMQVMALENLEQINVVTTFDKAMQLVHQLEVNFPMYYIDISKADESMNPVCLQLDHIDYASVLPMYDINDMSVKTYTDMRDLTHCDFEYLIFVQF